MNTQQLLNKAVTLLQQQKFAQAKAICRKLRHQAPTDFNACHLYAVVHMRDQQLKASAELFSEAIKLNAAAAQKAQAYSNYALTLQQLGQLTEADQMIQRALAITPTDPAFLSNAANICESLRQWPEMARYHQQVLTHDNTALDSVIGLAVALRQQQQLQQAQQVLDKIPDPARNLDWLREQTLLWLLNSQHTLLLSFIEQQSLPADLIVALADYVAEEHTPDAALPLYQQVLQLEPDNQTARHMMAAAEGIATERAPAAYVTSLYDQNASQFEQRLVGTLGYDAPTRLAKRLQQFCDSPKVVYDLGCGTGLMGEALQPLKPGQITGLDLSDQMLQLAAKKNCYSQLIQGDLLEAQLPVGQADLIVAADVLIYIGDLEPVFERVSYWLESDGIFALTIEQQLDRTEPLLSESGRFRHHPQRLVEQAEAAGLSLIEQERFPLRQESNELLTGEMFLFRQSGPK